MEKTYEITLDLTKPGDTVRTRKMFIQDAPDMYKAIELAEAKHGGKAWLVTETAESQAR